MELKFGSQADTPCLVLFENSGVRHILRHMWGISGRNKDGTEWFIGLMRFGNREDQSGITALNGEQVK